MSEDAITRLEKQRAMHDGKGELVAVMQIDEILTWIRITKEAADRGEFDDRICDRCVLTEHEDCRELIRGDTYVHDCSCACRSERGRT